MPTLRQQIQSKVDTLGVGYVTPIHTYSPDKLQTIVARVIWNDPRIYKPIFCLKELGIEKSLKSVVLEVRDSIARMYYILDSSCFFIDFQCDYQTLEVTKELPNEVIHYLRILCSKKGKLEVIVREDTLYLLFEDTFPSKMSTKERKEKEVDKYVLSIPLKEVDELDTAVVVLINDITELKDTHPIVGKNLNLPIDLSTITINKEPIEYWGSSVSTKDGDFTIVDTSGINSTLVICPMEKQMLYDGTMTMEEVEELTIKELLEDKIMPAAEKASKLKIKRAVEKLKKEAALKAGWIPEKDGDLFDLDPDYSSNYEEDMEDLNYAAGLVDSFMTDDGLFQENDEYLELLNDIMEEVDE